MLTLRLHPEYPAIALEPVQILTGSALPVRLERVPAGIRAVTAEIRPPSGGVVTAEAEPRSLGWVFTAAADAISSASGISSGGIVIRAMSAGGLELALGFADLIVVKPDGTVEKTDGGISRADFADVETASADDGLGAVKSKLNDVIDRLKG
jgi:hypothetical protein